MDYMGVKFREDFILLLSAKTIYDHIFYFLQSISFVETKFLKKKIGFTRG